MIKNTIIITIFTVWAQLSWAQIQFNEVSTSSPSSVVFKSGFAPNQTVKDTVITGFVPTKDPRKATLFSIFPGGGQIYNGRYWKAPIVWAALGTSIYFAVHNRSEYLYYKEQYNMMIDDDPDTVSDFEGQMTPEGVASIRNQYRSWMELSYVAIGAVYVLQMIEANVDAHLMDFNVSEDLAVNWTPQVVGNSRSYGLGIGLSLKFK